MKFKISKKQLDYKNNNQYEYQIILMQESIIEYRFFKNMHFINEKKLFLIICIIYISKNVLISLLNHYLLIYLN